MFPSFIALLIFNQKNSSENSSLCTAEQTPKLEVKRITEE